MTSPRPRPSTRIHLELMSKARLIAIARTAQARVDAARAEAERNATIATYWKNRATRLAALNPAITSEPDVEWERARELLAGIDPDPFASEHYRDLEDQVSADYAESIALRRRRRDLRATPAA